MKWTRLPDGEGTHEVVRGRVWLSRQKNLFVDRLCHGLVTGSRMLLISPAATSSAIFLPFHARGCVSTLAKCPAPDCRTRRSISARANCVRGPWRDVAAREPAPHIGVGVVDRGCCRRLGLRLRVSPAPPTTTSDWGLKISSYQPGRAGVTPVILISAYPVWDAVVWAYSKTEV